MMGGERPSGEVKYLPPIKNPSREQVDYFIGRAAQVDELFEQGGIEPEQAALERKLILARIGMGRVVEYPSSPLDAS